MLPASTKPVEDGGRKEGVAKEEKLCGDGGEMELGVEETGSAMAKKGV